MSDRVNFRMLPPSDDLASIPRELRFFPAENEDPQVLSTDALDSFNRDGYLAPISVFSRAEIADLRAYFDRLLDEALQAGRDSYSISSAHLRHGRVHDVLTEPRIVSVVSDLLGEDVIGWGSHFFCKMPGDGKSVAWHQDASYWPLTPSKTVTVWLAIDDADAENACMRFIAGSHLHGHIPWRASDGAEENVLDQTVEDPGQYGRITQQALTAGEASLHSDLLLHGSEANLSSRRRCGLTLRYCPASVRAHLDWNQKGVWVRGGDDSGHWRNRERPDHD